MRKLMLFLIILFAYSVSAFPSTHHVNIQVTNDEGVPRANTNYIFEFNITQNSDCTGVLDSNSTNLTTDSNGIINYTFTYDVEYSAGDYYLCYYRDGVLKNTEQMSSVPYSSYARNSSWSGIVGIPSDIADGDNDTTYSHLSNFTDDLDYSDKNVNRSDYWDNLNTTNSTQMENSGGSLNILVSWLESLFISDSDLPLANLTTPHCSNITGATSNLCTISDTDTQKTTTGFYLYNDSTTIHFNDTQLNDTIDSRAVTTEADPIWTANRTGTAEMTNITANWINATTFALSDDSYISLVGGDPTWILDTEEDYLTFNRAGNYLELSIAESTIMEINESTLYFLSDFLIDANLIEFSDQWCNSTSCYTLANLLLDTDTTIGNCSVDGSCPLITYDSELDYTGDDEITLSIKNITGTDNSACSGSDKVTQLHFDDGDLDITCGADVDTSINVFDQNLNKSDSVTFSGVTITNDITIGASASITDDVTIGGSIENEDGTISVYFEHDYLVIEG